MYQILGENFTFISTNEMDEFRKEQGWQIYQEYPYVLNAVENDEAYQFALQLARTSEVVILGSVTNIYFKKRMHAKNDGLTLRYLERPYKRGTWHAVSPRGMHRSIHSYHRYHNKNLYVLCASAYTSGDLLLHGAYYKKCYKWGYFPNTISYDIKELLAKKVNDKPVILWCARFLDWKHPKVPITLAARLRDQGIDYKMLLIGTGEEEAAIKDLIQTNRLESKVTLLGSMSPEKVREQMEQANIFLLTSDFQEGWGAVINEAMNSGCAVVASHAAGAVPYLIKDGRNGFIYENGNDNSLFCKVERLLSDRQLCEELGIRAFETITNEWNAPIAAKRLIELLDNLKLTGSCDRFQSGPCSRAEIIRNHWFQDNTE